MYFTRTMIAAAGAILALSGAVIGCGGSEDAAPSLTKVRWLKKANAICVRGNKKAGKLDEAAWARYAPGDTHVTALISDKVALALLPAREKELRQIRTLGLPRGSEGFVERMLQAWEQGIRKGRSDPRSLRGAGSDFAFYRSYSMGIDYGLEKCWLE
jgi:hypothetical protein